MKGYKVELSRPAQNYLSRLDRPTKERIVRVLWQLAENPDSNLLDIKPLSADLDNSDLELVITA